MGIASAGRSAVVLCVNYRINPSFISRQWGHLFMYTVKDTKKQWYTSHIFAPWQTFLRRVEVHFVENGIIFDSSYLKLQVGYQMSAIKCKLINVAYLYIQKYRDIMLLALKSICGSKGNGLLTILIKKTFLWQKRIILIGAIRFKFTN